MARIGQLVFLALTPKHYLPVVEQSEKVLPRAEEELGVEYSGEDIEIGFNVNYLLDALAAVDAEQVELGFIDSNSGCVIRGPESEARTGRTRKAP